MITIDLIICQNIGDLSTEIGGIQMKVKFIKRLSSFVLATTMMLGTAITASAEEATVIGQSLSESNVVDELACEPNEAGIMPMASTSVSGVIPAGSTVQFNIQLNSTGTHKYLCATSSSGGASGALILQLYNQEGKLVSGDWMMGTDETEVVSWWLFFPTPGTYTLKVIGHVTNKPVTFNAWFA